MKHDGITLAMEGTVNLQLSARNVGIFDAFYNSVKVSAVPVANVIIVFVKRILHYLQIFCLALSGHCQSSNLML